VEVRKVAVRQVTQNAKVDLSFPIMSKTKYRNWDTQDMEKALHVFRKCDMGLNFSGRSYGVPKAI
jgi:hypothetical protein